MKKLTKIIGWLGIVFLGITSLAYFIYRWEGIGFIAWFLTFPFGPLVGVGLIAITSFSNFTFIALCAIITLFCLDYGYKEGGD